MHLTNEEREMYLTSAMEREDTHRQLNHARQAQAYKLAQQAAKLLKEEFGASRVILFGSTLNPERFHLRSDIDLAVWNVQDYFRAVTCLLDLAPGFDFDLVPVEDARTGILDVILTTGKDL